MSEWARRGWSLVISGDGGSHWHEHDCIPAEMITGALVTSRFGSFGPFALLYSEIVYIYVIYWMHTNVVSPKAWPYAFK